MKRKIHVKSIATREIVQSVDVTGQSERSIEKIMLGMLRNMSDDYFISDSAHEETET